MSILQSDLSLEQSLQWKPQAPEAIFHKFKSLSWQSCAEAGGGLAAETGGDEELPKQDEIDAA